MEENRDKELDVFVEKSIKKLGLEETSSNFTVEVFSKIKPMSNMDELVYKPLIPNAVWFVIGLLVIGTFLFIGIADIPVDKSWYQLSKLNVLAKFNIFGKVGFISSTSIYAFVVLAVFVYIQIFLLKKYFSNRYILK